MTSQKSSRLHVSSYDITRLVVEEYRVYSCCSCYTHIPLLIGRVLVLLGQRCGVNITHTQTSISHTHNSTCELSTTGNGGMVPSTLLGLKLGVKLTTQNFYPNLGAPMNTIHPIHALSYVLNTHQYCCTRLMGVFTVFPERWYQEFAKQRSADVVLAAQHESVCSLCE